MTMKWNFSGYRLFCIAILLFAAGNSVWAQTVSREAQKHMNRGMAAVEMAKSPADYEEAIREFAQAARLAPRWQAPYFNLGYVQNKITFSDPILSLKDQSFIFPKTLNVIQGKSGSHKSRLAEHICSVLLQIPEHQNDLLLFR